jgi:hypothetical protein
MLVDGRELEPARVLVDRGLVVRLVGSRMYSAGAAVGMGRAALAAGRSRLTRVSANQTLGYGPRLVLGLKRCWFDLPCCTNCRRPRR